jgi:hypothetical protein
LGRQGTQINNIGCRDNQTDSPWMSERRFSPLPFITVKQSNIPLRYSVGREFSVINARRGRRRIRRYRGSGREEGLINQEVIDCKDTVKPSPSDSYTVLEWGLSAQSVADICASPVLQSSFTSANREIQRRKVNMQCEKSIAIEHPQKFNRVRNQLNP